MELQSSTTEKPSILVVDDNALIRNVIQNLLACEDYQVNIACNGKEALEVLDHEPIDVIICDVMMPQMDGYQFFQNVRSRNDHSHIPFVFLTALDAEEEVRKGYASGADDYITKPFDPDKLLAVVRGKILRSKNIKQCSEDNFEKFRKRVLHTLSHEFRTPLVAINTGSEMLLDDYKSSSSDNAKDLDKTKKLLEAIYRGGQRLENLVNDFMVLQQIEAGVATTVYEQGVSTCSVTSLLKSYITMMEKQWKAAGFAVRVSNMGKDEKVKIYEPQILEILKRVGENCIKFSSEIKEIDIAAYVLDHEVVIAVADAGKGFDTAYLREACGAFQQINREEYEQQGGGLGLTVASRYAEINHCRLNFANRDGGGAVVSLCMPRYTQ